MVYHDHSNYLEVLFMKKTNSISALVIVFYVLAVVMIGVAIYFGNDAFKYVKEYAEGYGTSISDMMGDAIGYICNAALAYVVYAIIFFGIAQLLTKANSILAMLAEAKPAEQPAAEVAAPAEEAADAEEATEEASEEEVVVTEIEDAAEEVAEEAAETAETIVETAEAEASEVADEVVEAAEEIADEVKKAVEE
jgi:hypothetical protein